MRINKYIALATGYSRRGADDLINAGRVLVNGQVPSAGIRISEQDVVLLDDEPISPPKQTIYDLLPVEYHELKPIGRLDKYSSGLLLLTNDGQLANELTHPRYAKTKIYEIELNDPLAPLHRQLISEKGITLDDGVSKLALERIKDGNDLRWRVTMREGRNRQIRRTFASLGYHVKRLHRSDFGAHHIGRLPVGQWEVVQTTPTS